MQNTLHGHVCRSTADTVPPWDLYCRDQVQGWWKSEQPVSAETDYDGDSLLHTIYLLQGSALHTTGSKSGPTPAMS